METTVKNTAQQLVELVIENYQNMSGQEPIMDFSGEGKTYSKDWQSGYQVLASIQQLRNPEKSLMILYKGVFVDITNHLGIISGSEFFRLDNNDSLKPDAGKTIETILEGFQKTGYIPDYF